MLNLQPHSVRKRKRKEPPLQQSGTTPSSKKHKRSHQLSESHPPPAYWEKLSKLHLTKEALREIDRRNDESFPNSPQIFRKRPFTRNFHAVIKESAREGGPDISDLRGFHSMSSSRSSSRFRGRGGRRGTLTASTGTSGAYSANFQQKLVDGKIFPPGYKFADGTVPSKPANWEDIKNVLLAHRESHSAFSEEDFENFIQADAEAHNEDAVKDSVITKLLAIGGPNGAQRNIRFTNLSPLDGFEEDDLKKPQPDYYCGTPPEQLNSEVRHHLSKYIIPSTSTNLPILANFFLEAKGPDGSLAVAIRQACFNGVHGTRGILESLSYGHNELVYDNKAYTLSTIYHGGQLKIYTHYAACPNGPGNLTHYYMHQVAAIALTNNKDSYVQGLIALRNGVQWAKEMREIAIARMNEMVGRFLAEDEDYDIEDDTGETARIEEDKVEEDDTDEAIIEESSDTIHSFHATGRTISSLADSSNESDTSVDELQRSPPQQRQAKRAKPNQPDKTAFGNCI